jgi:hypothetical protein
MDGKRMKAAASLATGGIERHNGASIVMPYGMRMDVFKDALQDRTALLAPNAIAATPAELMRLPLETDRFQFL